MCIVQYEEGVTLLHVRLKLKTWALASDLADTAFWGLIAVSNSPNQSVLSHFSLPALPLFSPSLTHTVQQPRLHPVSKAPGSDRSTGAGLQGYTPQALDAETGEASRRTCRTTTPPFLTLT